MKRAALALMLCLAGSSALADGLKPPPMPPAESAPKLDPPRLAPGQTYVVISAELVIQIQALIAAQKHEIERLRKTKSPEECT